MKTPNGTIVRMTKLSGPRWRLESEGHQIFIQKEGPGPQCTRLERRNEDHIDTYPKWAPAMAEALRLFDEWADKPPPPGAVDEIPEKYLPAFALPLSEYHVVWSGRTARECTTTIMEYTDQKHWDNFSFVTLYIVNWNLRRIVHTIDVPIDEKEGWHPDVAFEKIGEIVEDLEKLLRMYAYELEQGVMTWNDIQI